MISPDDAVQDLYRIAVVEGRTTSTVRLKMLADYCVQELEQRGLNTLPVSSAIFSTPWWTKSPTETRMPIR